jgi:acyl-CoA thioesterase I
MKNLTSRLCLKVIFYLSLLSMFSCSRSTVSAIGEDSNYLTALKLELQKSWPKNRIINLVFHGHSVPSGYLVTPVIDVKNAYPQAVLAGIAAMYPTATINSIRTCIGGENSTGGAKRFDTDVLGAKPDVLFIDYGLNDRGMGPDKARVNLEEMISKAKKLEIKIFLLTPTPDLNEDIKSSNAPLQKMSAMIRDVANKNDIGLIDSYKIFKDLAINGQDLQQYMAQNNHINAAGHKLVADEIVRVFKL